MTDESRALAPIATAEILPPTAVPTETSVERYRDAARAPNTLKAYGADLRDFTAWCHQHDHLALPALPQTVADYLAALADAGRKPSTIARRLAAISVVHQQQAFPSPTHHPLVREVWRGIRRQHRQAPAARRALSVTELRWLLKTLPPTLHGLRDRALLLVGFTGAFRRAELVSLDVADLEFVSEGVVVTLAHSKTDPTGHGRKVAIPRGQSPETCPVLALQHWLDQTAIATGPVFRAISRPGNLGDRLDGRWVAVVVQRAVAAVGLDPRQFGAHSLRAGLATSAARAGVPERVIMKQTGHRSVMALRRYVRDGELFAENAAATLGL